MIRFEKDNKVFRIAETMDEINYAKKVALDVYIESKYIENDVKDISDDYEESSIHVIACNKQTDQVIGSVRMICSNTLYAEEDFNITHAVDPIRDDAVEISRLAVLKDHRCPIAYLGMFKLLAEISYVNYEYWIAILRKAFLRKLKGGFSFSYKEIEEKELKESHLAVRNKMPGYYKNVNPYIFKISNIKKALEVIEFERLP